MANKRKPLRKGQAHVEYLALKPVIETLAEAGHNLKSIYDKLRDEGRISMSYQALHENMTRAERKFRPGQRGATGAYNQAQSAQHSKWRSGMVTAMPPGHEASPVSPTPAMQMKELDEAMELAAAKREKEPKKNDARKKVI